MTQKGKAPAPFTVYVSESRVSLPAKLDLWLHIYADKIAKEDRGLLLCSLPTFPPLSSVNGPKMKFAR